MSGNRCQYWSVDKDGNPIEPGKCSHWDEFATVCTAPVDKYGRDMASSAPFCNLIGTDSTCTQYKGTGVQARCILPDWGRHVVNRKTGNKWSTAPTVNENGDVTGSADFSAIDGYNNGKCDDAGTGHGDGRDPNFVCAAYSPYHLQFGTLQPAPTTATGIDYEGFTTVSGFGVRLPLGYEVYNKRAQLSRCYWWAGNTTSFSVVSTGDDYGKIAPLGTSLCNNPDEIVNNYKVFKFDRDTNMYRAPCNGCKPECPRYTGICWEYCTDVMMKHGDKVRAEQIMELRYYMRKDSWTKEVYEKSFADPDLYAWSGTVSYTLTAKNVSNYIIPSVRTYMDSFDSFSVKRTSIPLTQGIAADDRARNYPTLVKELQNMTFAPIIRNKFDTIEEAELGRTVRMNIFETNKFNHKHITIVGDHFYYGSEVYAINLSDPELFFLPKELTQYDNMSDIKSALVSTFTEFYTNLDCVISNLVNYMPEKIPASQFGGTDCGFYIDAETFFGYNTIMVITKGSGRWEFSKIKIKKIFCGGVIGQLSFKVEGDGKEAGYLPSYESSFNANLNNNGKIDIQFFPMDSNNYGDKNSNVDVYCFYNDFVRKQLPAITTLPPEYDTYEMGYKLYRIKYPKVELSIDNVRFFGNAGYALVTASSGTQGCFINHAFKPWELDNTSGKIYISYPFGNIYGDANETAEMEVYAKCSDSIDSNQFVIRPKDVKKFVSVCKNAKLIIENLYVYEKRSFNEVPTIPDGCSYEIVKEDFVGEDNQVVYRLNESITHGEYGSAALGRFGYSTLNIGAVYKGLTGRIRGQTKTKLITWVRQPFCRDVEIYYNWVAAYEESKLLPEFDCHGTRGESLKDGLKYRSSIPSCGDHDLSRISGLGPMWYPYTDCDSIASYNIVGNLSEWDTNIMEVFSERDSDTGAFLHGQHDMRMLGPDQNYGWTCDTHASLWACTCDWTFCNARKKTKNMFTGFARYRGGMDYTAKERCVEGGGDLPKFGNVYRDFLRSYRAIDNVEYYYFDSFQYVKKQKWAPVSEYFSDADITNSTSSTFYLSYSSNDYYDDGSMFVDQMGTLLADNDIEGVSIGERISIGSDRLPVRYKFDDVFRHHYTVAGTYYPYPKDPQQIMINFNLLDIISWYTYKDFPGGDTTKSIQWAWREMWKDIERRVVTDENLACQTPYLTYKGVHPCLVSPEIPQERVLSPYTTEVGVVVGKHAFLSVAYPDYEYDYTNKEHRLVCDEGDHTVTVTPKIYDDEGKLKADPHWELQLNSGAKRCFDFDGNWVDTGEECDQEGSDLYSVCTVYPWVEDISIFDTGYNSTTPNPDRTMTNYDSGGEPYDTYYQRGLNITPLVDMFSYLPTKAILIDPVTNNCQVKFSKNPSIPSDDDWANLDTSQWYPAANSFGLTYTESDSSLDIEYDLGVERKMGVVVVDYTVGSEGQDITLGKTTVWSGTLYNIPGIKIYKSTDGVTYTEIHNVDTMYLSTKQTSGLTQARCYYEFDDGEFFEPYRYLKISLRFVATADEIRSYKLLEKYYSLPFNTKLVNLKSVYLYKKEFVEAKETIKTYERKYNISYGSHGDFPPHGYNSTGSLFYVNPTDPITADQMDNIGGVTSMPGSAGDCKTMSRGRGRILKACHPDKEEVTGSNTLGGLYNAENEQAKIHNDIAINSGSTSFTMSSIVPPGLEDKLLEIGLTFPRWNCIFTNTIVLPLAIVPHYDTFNGAGHLFVWNTKDVRSRLCGRLFARFVADVVEAEFINAGTLDVTGGYIDAIVAYLRGVGSLLVNPFVYQARDQQLRDLYTNAYKSQSIAGTALQLQEAASPLY